MAEIVVARLHARQGSPRVLGGGVVLDGKLWEGRGGAGEIGHMVVKSDGRTCPCGRVGCMEAYAGRGAMENRERPCCGKGFNGRSGWSSSAPELGWAKKPTNGSPDAAPLLPLVALERLGLEPERGRETEEFEVILHC